MLKLQDLERSLRKPLSIHDDKERQPLSPVDTYVKSLVIEMEK